MPAVSWHASTDGRYWIDVSIGPEPVRTMIALGLVDPLQAVGFELEPNLYDQLKQTGLMTRFQYRYRRDANGQVTGCAFGKPAKCFGLGLAAMEGSQRACREGCGRQLRWIGFGTRGTFRF